MIGQVKKIFLTIFCMLCSFFQGQSQSKKTTEKLYGFAADQYVTASVLFQDKLNKQANFDKNWVVQMSQVDSELDRFARIENKKLAIHDPRGATIWFKKKLKGPIMICYKVMVPAAFNQGNDIMARDINQFWMANAPNSTDAFAKGGLFDATVYDGDFKSYDVIQSYYASTGGGNTIVNNRTVRMRRYPRKVAAASVDHLGLNFRDAVPEFLIVPNKEHQIQLVAANDVVQYIFDGKIVYEIKSGSEIDILNDFNKNSTKAIWGVAPWLPYDEGYFGFRMTRSHHIYSDFKVFQLKKRV